MYKRSTFTAVAIGFRNNVRDDVEDKRWIANKILADAESARRSGAKRFVFLTNVDLTPKEIEEAFRVILQQGFQSCDVLHRERLRLLLDSPEGLGFRTAYLQIPLEAAEQAAFFEKFLSAGSASAANAINERLDRMEFREEMSRPIDSFSLSFDVREENWWHKLAGGVVSIKVGSGLLGNGPFVVRTITAVMRRVSLATKKLDTGPFKGVGRWVHLDGMLQREESGTKSTAKVQLPVLNFDTGRITIHIDTRQMFEDMASNPAKDWLDRSSWQISVPKPFADIVDEVQLFIDSWWITSSANDHLYKVTPLKIDLSSTVPMHRREKASLLAHCASFDIDFRRISPQRSWDRQQ